MKYLVDHLIKKTMFLLLTALCTSCTISIGSEREIQTQTQHIPDNAKIHILSENIFINGKSTSQGEMFTVKTGANEVSFHGELLRPVTIKTETTPIQDTAESLRFLTCIAFLPICALTRGHVFETDPKISYVHSDCKASSTLNTEAGITYKISVLKNYNNAPLLIVVDTTYPSYRLIEQEMSCIDLAKTGIKNMISNKSFQATALPPPEFNR